MGDYYEQQFEVRPEREGHLRDYLQIAFKRKGIILSSLLAVLIVTVVRTYTAAEYYTATSQVLIERNYDTRNFDGGIYYQYDPEFLNTQAEIIKSLNVAQRVVDNLALTQKYRHYFFPVTQTEQSLLLSAQDSVREWLGSLVSILTGEIKPEAENSTESVLLPEAEAASEKLNIARMISSGLSVSPVGETKIVSISYTDRNPVVVEMIANAVATAYMDEMLEIKMASSSRTIRWMTSKVEEEKEKLEKAERALQQYKRENDLVTIEDRLAIYPQKMTELSSQLSEAEARSRELAALVSQIESAGENFDALENIPVFADSQVLKQLRDSIYKARQNVKELSKKYGPKHPMMIQARSELDVLQNESRREVRRIVAATRNAYKLAVSEEKGLQESINRTKNEILDLNEKFIQYASLARDVESSRRMYEILGTGLKQQDITEQAQSVNIWVVKAAERPGGPSRPNKRRSLMLGLVLGLAGGLGLAFLVEYLDNTAKSDIELEQRYGLTVLGTVENIAKSGGNVESHIIDQPLSPLAESYRLIRTGLLLSSAEKPPGLILITSMGPKEGKTSTALNLARIMAQGGKKVLILDCDLRRPRMHILAGVANETGLSSYLSGLSDEEILLPIPDDDLMLMPSGPIPPNPGELLGSRRMQDLLERLRQQFDFVLLDSSPVQSVTDSLALGRIVDGTIIVVRFGKTTYDMLNGGMKKLHDVNIKLLGFVLNGLKKREARGYYGYYSYYKKDDYHG